MNGGSDLVRADDTDDTFDLLTVTLVPPIGLMVEHVRRRGADDLAQALEYARQARDHRTRVTLGPEQYGILTRIIGRACGSERLFWQSFRVGDWDGMIRELETMIREQRR